MSQFQFLGGNQNIGQQRFVFDGEQLTDGEILQTLRGILSSVLGEEEAEQIIKAALARETKQADD
jgi:hypothetical protein